MQARIVTTPYEPAVFIHGVFAEDFLCLTSDSLSGIEFTPEMFDFRPHTQTLSDFCDLTKKVLSGFYSVIGPQSLAQYSLLKQKKIACLTRYDLFYRHASPNEIEYDVEHFGEQVIGPLAVERPDLADQHPTFIFWDKPHYFTGPPRMIKAIFNTRTKCLEKCKPFTAFTHLLPHKEIISWFAELDSAASEQLPDCGNYKFLQTYFLFIFDHGEIRVQTLEKHCYNADKFNFYGNMLLENGNLYFLFEGNKEAAIDYTESLQA